MNVSFTSQMLRLLGIDVLKHRADYWKSAAEHHAKLASAYRTLARRARNEISRRKAKK